MDTSPTLLRPRRGKWLLLALASLAFVLAGVSLGADSLWDRAGIAFFGLCFLVSLVTMLPGGAYLRLTSEGFTMCSLFRTHTFRWADVEGFVVGRVLLSRKVMVKFAGSFPRSRALRWLNVRLFGFEGALPDSYGLRPEELADLLNAYKASAQAA